MASATAATASIVFRAGPAVAAPLDGRPGPTTDALTARLRRLPRVLLGTTPNQGLGTFQERGGFRCVDAWWNRPDEVPAHSDPARRQRNSWYYGQNLAVCLYIWTAPEHDRRNLTYNLSDQFLRDLDTVIRAYMPLDPATQPPLRVVLWTEIENFAPAGDVAYRAQLKQQFRRGVEVVHAACPTALVGCGFIASTSPEWRAGNARSGLLEEWAELLSASDFASTNMMMDTRSLENGEMARATRAAIAQLGETGKPVYINHWVTWIVSSQKPLVPANHHTQLAWAYLQDIFTDESLRALVEQGLAGWGWKAEGWITNAAPHERDQILRHLGGFSMSARR